MASSDLKYLRSKIASDMRKLVSEAEKSGGHRADWRLFDALDASQSALKMQLDEAERRERMERAVTDNYHAAWMAFMRRGLDPSAHEKGITPEQRTLLLKGEQRDMTVGSGGAAYPGSTTGFFAPMDFERKVEGAMKYYAPMLDVCTPLDTVTGSPLPYPTDSDINTVGEQVNENAQVTVADVPLGQTLFKSYKYSSKLVKVSLDLLQDSAFDFETYLAEKFGYRIGRALNPLLTNGSGTGQPLGLLTGLPIGVGPSTTPAIVGNDNLTTPDPTQQVGYIDLVNLERSLDPVYRRGATWMMNDQTYQYVRTLKDQAGRPIFLRDELGSEFGSILGYPVTPNCDYPTLGAGNVTVTFGRHDKYCVRRAGPMWVQRLSLRFIDYGQVAFIGWARRDGQLLDAGTHPVVALKQHS